MKIRLTQIDGSLPNLALMKLAAFHRAQGDEITFTREARRDLFEPDYDRVYGSAIFKFSTDKIARFKAAWPDAIVGGTGSDNLGTVEQLIGESYERYDYSLYPKFEPSIGFTQRGCRLSCKFCLAPDTLIITAEGPKRIADIKVGELVLTHKGRYRPVTHFLVREHKGPILQIASGAISNLFPVKITGEHPVLTRRLSYRSGGQKLTSFNWREAKDLKRGHQQRSRDRSAYPRTTEVIIPDDWKCPGASWLPLGPEAMTLIGWYLAEGYITTNEKRGDHLTTFCLGHSEIEMAYAQEIKAAGAACGIHVGIMTPKIGIRAVISRNQVARWLKVQFGTGASAKSIPLWIRHLPPALLQHLLHAWAKGDGWFHIRKGIPTWRIATVSLSLAVALREIALKCGYDATINRHHTSDIIQGRKVNVKPAYTVSYHARRTLKQPTKSDDVYVYGRLEDSSSEPYDGLVYNLEVAEDNSYCTPAFALHNCVVPSKEGKAYSLNTIADIWRGDGHPRKLHLLDNDFFGQPEDQWRARIAEIQDGGFKVCLNQGINVRHLSPAAAEAIASIEYRDDAFSQRRLYTAWDNLKDEAIFFNGVDMLEKAGIPPKHLRTYMLVGFDKKETWDRIWHRFNRMVERGIEPYPMVFDCRATELERYRSLKQFQRWVVTGLYRAVPFSEYDASIRSKKESAEVQEVMDL